MEAAGSLTITLSGDLADRVRSHVASGDFPSEADVIESGIYALDDSLTIEPWQLDEARAALAELDADRSTGLTSVQVQTNIRAESARLLALGK